jgi:hypothetical protein
MKVAAKLTIFLELSIQGEHLSLPISSTMHAGPGRRTIQLLS